jgi:hypothetical protein
MLFPKWTKESEEKFYWPSHGAQMANYFWRLIVLQACWTLCMASGSLASLGLWSDMHMARHFIYLEITCSTCQNMWVVHVWLFLTHKNKNKQYVWCCVLIVSKVFKQLKYNIKYMLQLNCAPLCVPVSKNLSSWIFFPVFLMTTSSRSTHMRCLAEFMSINDVMFSRF